MSSPELIEVARLISELHRAGSESGIKLFVVGGVVRDLIRGNTTHDRDLDIVVEGNAIEFAERVTRALGGTLKKFPDFCTAKLLRPAGSASIDELDFASTRTEVYPAPGSLPVVSIAAIGDDLKRRDFTINAMAIELSKYGDYIAGRSSRADFDGAILDLFGGREDLSNRRIRVLHPASFLDDPTRLFRACRYAARLGGDLESRTAELFAAAVGAGALKTISRFRIATELKKMAQEDDGAAVFRIADRLGLLKQSEIVPEDRYPDFFERLQATANADQSPEGRVRDLLKVVAAVCGSDDALRRLSAFGLSKRKILDIIEESGA